MTLETIKIKKLNADATIPTRSHSTDAGLDIFASEEVILQPQQKCLLGTGIAVGIPPGFVGLLTSRSGVSSKTDLVIETGKIDAGFTGEMKINIKNDEDPPDTHTALSNMKLDGGYERLMYNIKGKKIDNGNPFNLASGRTYKISKGDKIAQLVISPIETPVVNVVKDFDGETERGENGFGSTDNPKQRAKEAEQFFSGMHGGW